MNSLRGTVSIAVLPLVLWFAPAGMFGEAKQPVSSGPRGSGWTLPLAFERNEGQMPAGVSFLGRTRQYTVAVGADGLRFSLPGAAPVELSFPGGHGAAPVGMAEAPFRTNEYVGTDVSKYRAGVRNYTRIGMSHVYPGVDAEFYASGDAVEHDFIVAPGADAGTVRMRLGGGRPVALNDAGEVVVGAERGELRLKRPLAYQLGAGGQRVEVAAAFALDGRELRFRLGKYDHARRLVIDPVIVYATFAAGTAGSAAGAIGTDPSGNVYVAGTTASTAFGTTPVPTANCGATPCAGNVFVAKLASGGTGLAWITYLGTEVGGSITTVTSLVTDGTNLYLGGSTNDTAIASGATTAVANATGGYVGYLSGLAAGTGALSETALLYLDATPNNSSVQALALDAYSNLLVAGALGTTTAPSPQLITPTSYGFSVSPLATSYVASAQPQPGNAFVMIYGTNSPLGDPVTGIARPAIFTYVQTNSQINGIAADTSGGQEDIYVAGQTTGGFALAEGAGPATNTTGLNNAFELTFTVFPTSVPPTVDAFTWIDGSGSDTVAGIALGASGTSYLFGNTTSTDLPSTSGVVQTAPSDSVANGFVALAGATGTSGVAPVALTYLGGSGTVDTVTGGAFANGTVYVTGQTNAPAVTDGTVPATAFAGVATTVASATAPFNAQALAYGMDTTGGTGTRGYLVSLGSALTGVNYVANVGGAGGTDTVAGVALDGSYNAYVAGTIGFGSAPYVSYGAYQTVSPATAAASAYVAEIGYAATAGGVTLSAASSGSPSVNPVGYASGTSFSSVTYTWVLTAPTAVGPANLVVQVPVVAQLTYGSASITDATNPSAAAIPCAVTAAGVYCVVGTIAQTGGVNDTLNLVVNATVPVSAAGLTGAFNVTATVAGAASEYATSAQANTLAAPAVLTITPPATFGAATVFSTDSTATVAGTQATYAFRVTNTGTGDSAATSFGLTLPNYFHVVSVSAPATSGGVAATCDTSGGTGCSAFSLPAGGSLVYSVTGTYADAAVGSSGSAAAAPSFAATASGYLSSASATVNPNTTIERGVHLVVAGSLSAMPSGQTSFNLGDAMTYTVTVMNQGPSATSGTDPLTLTLPTGFVATAGSCAAPYTSCTVPVLALGASTSFSVTGSFPDAVTNAGVLAAAVAKTFAATVTLPLVGSYDAGGAAADYATSTATGVQRTAVLTVTTSSLTSPGTVCAGGGTTCVYMLNAGDTKDRVPYRLVVQNAGPNVAVNARVTITLPFVPANPVGTAHPLVSGTPVVVAATPGFGTGLTCSYAAGANQITCTGGNLPVTAAALAVSGAVAVDAAALPVTVVATTTAGAPGSVVVLEDANGAPGTVTLPTVEVDRAAHLVTAKAVVASGTAAALPVNLDENAPSVAAGGNDTVTVTVQVGNTPLNNAPGVVVTEMLPPYFRVTGPPAAGAGCTVGGAAVAANLRTAAAPVAMTCAIGTVAAGNATASSGGAGATVGSSPVSFSYAGKFVDNGINADVTGTLAAKMKSLTVTLPTAVSATSVAVDPFPNSDATSGAPSIGVVRSAHLVLRKLRNPTVAAPPASFVDTTDPNLDEKTTATPFGVNDEVEYGIAIGNAGVNTALGVQFTETLPPYFTLVRAYLVAGAPVVPDLGANTAPAGQLPASSLACYVGSVVGGTPLTLPYPTGGSAQPITCTYGTAANPLSLPVGPSLTGAPDGGTSVEFIYQGKYQDNAPGVDNIGAGVSTAAIASSAGDATAAVSLAVDNGPASDGKSLALATYSIQRAAHLSVVGTPFQGKPDETALTAGSLIAQAEPSAAGGTPVFNCLRYKVLVQNSGPNIARQPTLTLAPPTGLNLTSSPNGVTTTAATDGPLPSGCAYAASIAPVVTGAVSTGLVPVSERAGNTLVLDVEGYFGLDTLTPFAVNQRTGFAVSYTGLADAGVKESVKSSPFVPIAGGSVTVVNTPAGANFFVTPFSATGTRPARLAFGTVTVPGVTTETVSVAGPAMPSGPSPDPRGNRATVPLYRTGSVLPQFYSFGTTAAPAAGTNPTGICLTNGTAGAALADGFAKPERALLWALAGLPSGSLVNAVPNVAAPYAGDVTTSIAAAGGLSYVEAGGVALPYAVASSLPGVQAQPSQVCGQVNGFAPAAAPMTVAVLEPVNFAPLITASTQQAVQAPGKGVSEVAFFFPQTIHDYNDSDPCYVAGSATGTAVRGVCDDNLVLTTWVFGGENLIPSLGHVVGPMAPAAATAFLNESEAYEVQAGRTLFLQVADQLGALAYNAAKSCDPGNAPGSYTPVATVAPCPLSTSALTGNPPQEAIFGGAEIALLTPSVNGGTSGLVALPPAADPASVTTGLAPGYVMATATVTAGQTAGFQWGLESVVPVTGGTYTLTCSLVDNATQAVVAPFPAGLSCQIPASITYPANPTTANSPADPAIYIVTAAATTAANWRMAVGGVVAALLLPLVWFRRRSRWALLAVMTLMLGGLAGLAGCGTGFNATASTVTTGVAAGTYTFRATATPVKGGVTLTTAPFQVKVVTGN